MADLDVRVGSRSGADAIEEVAVVRRSFEAGIALFAQDVPGSVELPAADVFAEQQHAVGAVDGIAVFASFLDVG